MTRRIHLLPILLLPGLNACGKPPQLSEANAEPMTEIARYEAAQQVAAFTDAALPASTPSALPPGVIETETSGVGGPYIPLEKDPLPPQMTAPAAPTPAPAPAALPQHYIEAGINAHSVSRGGGGNWFGQYARGEYQFDENDRFSAEVLHQRAFDDSGTFFSVGNTHVWDENWFTNVSAGTSTRGDFLPQYRIDADINRKWLEKRNLITTFGMGYYNSRTPNEDVSLTLGATYYFDEPWIAQGGVRLNVSAPGGVFAPRVYGALTYGTYKNQYITGRLDIGREGYQPIGAGNTITNFSSGTASLEWKKWVDEDWGFKARGEHYRNPFYHRTGMVLGVFREF